MLGRKQSIKVGDTTLLDPGGPGPGGLAAGGPNAFMNNINEMNNNNANMNMNPNSNNANINNELAHSNHHASNRLFKKSWVRHSIRICSLGSLISVCANSTQTFDWFPKLFYITFIVDSISAIVFTIEMVFKIYTRGLIRGPNAYLRNRWCQFDASMVIFIWISIILQILEGLRKVVRFSVLSVLRSPRPLILIRLIREFLKFSMPKSRIKQIFIRSSQQIYNVTLFFLFFMSLYGLLGVQLFGQIEKHCVINGTSLDSVKVNTLAIPDTHCSGHPEYGNQCPVGMQCMELHMNKNVIGYNGFEHIGYSLYTVYQTSSQEGWAHLMYSTFDHYPAWKVASYFVSLIFFLGWMVRNVFIAVFTETFNEIRVQFQQMWGERQALASEGIPRILRGDDDGWKLVEMDESQSTTHWVPQYAKKFLNSATFQVIVLMAILSNAFLSASIKFKHDGRTRESFYSHIYWWEVGFTIFFDIETLFKIACLGFNCYWTRTSHRFEFLLAIGTTINIIPSLFMSELTDFQVFRVIRLIKASPVLEDFAYKSFGPGRKLGTLVIITFCILVVTASIAMQLFCSLQGYHRFQDFSFSFMSIFQILTQEAWTDVMNETMLRVTSVFIGTCVAFCFIMYHLFVSLIVISIFVAAILDNLELPEDLKKAKQEKAREQIACISEELPLRLRLFERFPDSPQMTKLNKSASEFNVPKVRESFMRIFVDDINNHSTIKNCLRAGMVQANSLMANNKDLQQQQCQLDQQRTFENRYHRKSSKFTSSKTSNSANTKKQVSHVGDARTKPNNSSQASKKQQHENSISDRPPLIHSDTSTSLGTFVAGGAGKSSKLNRLPSLKLLSHQTTKISSSNKRLRKSTIHKLIEESNLKRMSLVNEDGLVFVKGSHHHGHSGDGMSGGGLASGGPKSRGATSQLLKQQQQRNNDQSGGSFAAAKFQHHSHHQPSTNTYDYLRESGEGIQENLRNPQDLNIKMLKRKRQQAELKRSQREKDLRENHPLFDTPLFIIGRESKFRKFCQLLAWSRYEYNDRDPITGKHRKSNYKTFHNLLGLVSYLDWCMIVMTTISCVFMMFETPKCRLNNKPMLQYAEYAFVISMTIELSLKTLANGLLFTPKAVLSTAAGIMNVFIFITSLTLAIWMPREVEPQSFAQYLLLLRCVRPLRIFSLIPHMRQVVYELVRGFKAIFLVCILLALLCFVFACYGVHAYGGRLARCTDPQILERENCTGVFLRKLFVTKMRLPTEDADYPAMLVSRVWANPHRFSFDDITSAMLALFEVLSYKGWVDIREALLKRFDSSIHTIYIHVFVFVGCMVGVTLFVGVVIANYGENKGTALLTVDQRRWCDLKKRLKIAQPLHLPPRPDHVRFRAIIYDIIQNIKFKRFIAILVLSNSALLMVHWEAGNNSVPFTTISACLTLAFTIEVIMKMIAFTPRGYWQSRRNRYDLAVTFIGSIWVINHWLLTNKFTYSFGFIVVILRFFTITGKHATLQMLMLTVVVSVYKSFFIILGLFTLVLFYSLLGVQLFGSVKFGENLSRQANFRNAKLSAITMFRIVTGEDWYRMMHDCMLEPPYCTKAANYWETDCGNFGMSFTFFSSFYIIITHMVLNLLVAIIMENFSIFYSSEEDALLSYTDIRNFQYTWNMVDAQQKGTIPVRRVKFILRLLKGRLEVDPARDQQIIKHMCHEMERLHNGEDVSFHDVLTMLSYRSVDINKSLQFEELLARNELENIIEEEVAKKTIRQWLDQCLRRVKQQRQQNSLIQGLRLTNMSGTDLFLPTPKQNPAVSSSSDHSPQSPQVQSHLVFGSDSDPLGGAIGFTNQSSGGAHPIVSLGSGSTAQPSVMQTPSQTASNQASSNANTGIQAHNRLASSSTSESQHSITSAATITTLAASIGKLKRRAEASRSESISIATGAQRKLLTQSGSEAKKADDRAHLRRAIKALTSGTSAGQKMSFVAANKPLDSTTTQQNSIDEDNQQKTKQFRPKLNAAIHDIHQWWDYQVK